MSDTYPCTYPNCDKIFSKAFELKKHKATHENPDSVFYCPECNFITLQKKNLAIHFAIHTGEKIHQCPDMVGPVGSSRFASREERCEYRTNDPAALTKHRKRAHGYIPPPSRSRPARGVRSAPRQPRKKTDRKVRCPSQPSRHPPPVSYPKPSRTPEKSSNLNSGAGYMLTCTAPPEASSAFLYQGNMDTCEQSTITFSSDVSECDSSISSSSTLFAPEEEMQLDALYDPSLQSEWMAKYETSYSMFDMTGMKYLPEPLPANSPSEPPSLDISTGREGCLCPEWMVEAGIEGWDRSVLDTHRQFYALDA